jgi:hypothetical protein
MAWTRWGRTWWTLMPSGNATSRTTRLVRSTSVAMLGYRAGRNGEWRLVQERAVAERRRELGTVFQFDSFFRASVASRSSPAAQSVTVAPCIYGMRCCAIRRVCHAVLAVVGLHAHADDSGAWITGTADRSSPRRRRTRQRARYPRVGQSPPRGGRAGVVATTARPAPGRPRGHDARTLRGRQHQQHWPAARPGRRQHGRTETEITPLPLRTVRLPRSDG